MIKNEPGFYVIGIETRTTNKAEMAGAGNIAQLWQRVFTENLFARIPNKADTFLRGVYHDYESDKDGAYTLLVGVRVTSLDDIPEGMVGYQVPAGKFQVFTTERGPVGHVVVKTWMDIWRLEDEGKLNRAYTDHTADYELYTEWDKDRNNEVAEIHIAIK